MDYENLISTLKLRIHNELYNLLCNKPCVLLDVPHHENIGDILIWQGEQNFLKHCNSKCLFQHSLATFDFRPIPKDIIILLHGGGNFGDLWFHHHKFKQKVIKHYPNNKIIIFPQTVWFESQTILNEDITIFNSHPDLTICARDEHSYQFLKKHYHCNTILLVPDMAFYINDKILFPKKSRKKALFFKRTDKELSSDIKFNHYLPTQYDQHDWVTFEKNKYSNIIRFWGKLHNHPTIAAKYWEIISRPLMIAWGVRMLSRYESIYTTRLHGAILSILLGKEIHLFDNSYSKNKNFYETWLSGVRGINLIDK